MKPRMMGKYDMLDYIKQCRPDINSNSDTLSISTIWHVTILEPDQLIDEDCVICQVYRKGDQCMIALKFINRPSGIIIDEMRLVDGSAILTQSRKPLSWCADTMAF